MRGHLLLGVLLLAGCAAATPSGEPIREPITATKGRGLATVAVMPADLLPLVCGGHGTTLGCVPQRTGGVGVTIYFREPPAAWGLTQAQVARAVEVSAHELCHAVYLAITETYWALAPYLHAMPDALVERFRVDPCHAEDGGRIR